MREARGDWAVITDTPSGARGLLHEGQAEAEGCLALIQIPSVLMELPASLES